MTTTPTATPELLDLDKLEALAKAAQISILRMGMNGRPNDYFALMNAMSPEAVLALIALARRAQPEGEAPQADPEQPNGGMHDSIFVKVWGDAGGGDAGRRKLADYAYALGKRASATLSPLCGAQHAESGKDAYQVFSHDSGEWYGVDEAQYDRAHYSCRRVLAAQQAAAQGTVTDYGTSVPGTPEAPKQPAHGHRDDYYLLANGRRLGLEPISRVRNMPNWVLAMELFATGSSSAHQICRDAGIDPDSTTIQRATAPKGGVA